MGTYNFSGDEHTYQLTRHLSNISQIEQVIIRVAHTYMHTVKTDEKEFMNLKESKEGHMKGFRGGKGRERCCNYNLKNEKEKDNTSPVGQKLGQNFRNINLITDLKTVPTISV